MSGHNKLRGLRVLNTRPLEQGKILSQAIHEAGGTSVDFPTLAIEPVSTDWLEALPSLSEVQHAIFISSNAAQHFCAKLKDRGLRWPSTIQTTAIGKASAAALVKWGIRVDNTPSKADSEHLLQLDSLQDVRNQTILLIKGEGGREEITNTLLQRNANVISVEVYRRILPTANPQYTHSLWHDNVVDIILFTSQQAMNNLFILLKEDAHTWIRRTPCLVISERLAEEASQLGIQTIIVSHYDTIVSALEFYNQGLTHDKQH